MVEDLNGRFQAPPSATQELVEGSNLKSQAQFCDEKQNSCSTHNENEIYYRDNNHLSFQGNNLIIHKILEYINY